MVYKLWHSLIFQYFWVDTNLELNIVPVHMRTYRATHRSRLSSVLTLEKSRSNKGEKQKQKQKQKQQ